MFMFYLVLINHLSLVTVNGTVTLIIYRPWAESRTPPPPGIFVDHIFFKPYYVPSYFQVVCRFSMHGQGHQRSSKYGTLYP